MAEPKESSSVGDNNSDEPTMKKSKATGEAETVAEEVEKNGRDCEGKSAAESQVASSCATKNERRPLIPLSDDHTFQRQHTKFHILIGVTGSVAAIKLPELVKEISRQDPSNRVLIRVVTTESGVHFFDPAALKTAEKDTTSSDIVVYRDQHEWLAWTGRGDPIVHIELRKWADLMLIAPLDANTLGKIANGLCDNLLTSLIRAWDPKKPLYFAPAMNTFMLEHPLTFKHLDVLKNLLNYKEIPSVEKELMCGDKGYGAMAPVPMIASVVIGEVKKKFSFVSRS